VERKKRTNRKAEVHRQPPLLPSQEGAGAGEIVKWKRLAAVLVLTREHEQLTLSGVTFLPGRGPPGRWKTLNQLSLLIGSWVHKLSCYDQQKGASEKTGWMLDA